MSGSQVFGFAAIAGGVAYVFLPDVFRKVRGWWRGEPVVVKNWRWPV